MISLRFTYGALMGFAAAMLLAVVLFSPNWRIALPLTVLSMLVGGVWNHRSWVEKRDRAEKVERLTRDGPVDVDENGLVNMVSDDILPFLYQLIPGENKVRRAHRLSRSRLALVPPLVLLLFFSLFMVVEGGSQHIGRAGSIKGHGGGITLPILTPPKGGSSLPEPEGGKSSNLSSRHKTAEKLRHKSAAKKRKHSQVTPTKHQHASKNAVPEARHSIDIPRRPVYGPLAVLAGLLALMLWVWWKWAARLVTNYHNIDAWVPPTWLPFLPVKFNATALAFIKDVDPANTVPSRALGMGAWGTVMIKVLYSDDKGTTRDERIDLHSVPKHEAYVASLKAAARAAGGMTSLREDIRETAAGGAT
jgi:hypothetical protein